VNVKATRLLQRLLVSSIPEFGELLRHGGHARLSLDCDTGRDDEVNDLWRVGGRDVGPPTTVDMPTNYRILLVIDTIEFP
jgi:hypothetical protein